MSLAPCSKCARHVRVDESSCPFCGGTTSIEPHTTVAAPRPARIGIASRAALFYLGASAAACMTLYGGPPVEPEPPPAAETEAPEAEPEPVESAAEEGPEVPE